MFLSSSTENFNIDLMFIFFLWSAIFWVFGSNHLLVKLIGVNKGRRVTLKYFRILINVSRKHKVYIGHEQSPSLIRIVVK